MWAGARFAAPVQTGPGVHPTSCTMGTGSFRVVKRPGCGVDHPPHLAPRLKKEYSYTFTPLWAFVVCYRVTFNCYIKKCQPPSSSSSSSSLSWRCLRFRSYNRFLWSSSCSWFFHLRLVRPTSHCPLGWYCRNVLGIRVMSVCFKSHNQPLWFAYISTATLSVFGLFRMSRYSLEVRYFKIKLRS